MTPVMHDRIDVALKDLTLQRALGAATSKFKGARATASAQLSDWEELRQRAHEIKRHTIDNLGTYLEQFEATVVARGGKVFWAKDAQEACSYVCALAEARGVKSVVKSKSMVSEEIELNHALAAKGIESVETDLGEYIIQIAGETPSHIIAPAIHKTRDQIAQLFEEKLGLPFTQDVTALTSKARQVLRQKFLNADMGITGANFGVAETGTVVLVENEGNIRFSSGRPRIHVALMGVERVIPRLRDLAIFLNLLARSATGQKLSSYTSILTGAKRPGEPDGPQEFHVVLVDNGRTRALADPLLRETLYCIRCGACLNVCPVYRKIGGHAYPWVYSGPIGAILTPQARGLDSEPTLPFASSLCGACSSVCPVKIPIPEILLKLREQEVESAPQRHRVESFSFKAWSRVMRSPWLYELAGSVARRAMLPIGPAGEWHKTRELPQAPATSFRKWWRQTHKEEP